MMKFFRYLLIVPLFAVGLNAQTKYTASFLELGIGARALGMDSAYAALSNDATGFTGILLV